MSELPRVEINRMTKDCKGWLFFRQKDNLRYYNHLFSIDGQQENSPANYVSKQKNPLKSLKYHIIMWKEYIPETFIIVL